MAPFLILGGCSYKSKKILFKFDKKVDTQDLPIYVVNGDSASLKEVYIYKIKPDDRIALRFLNNFSVEEGMTLGLRAGQQEMTFVVDEEGRVALPLLGRVKIEDLTRLEAVEKLETAYADFLVQPNLDIVLQNRTVTVLGEVTRQGVFELKREQISLIEALSLAGGMNKRAKITNVKLIRQKGNNEREVFIFDLRKQTALSRPEIFIRDRDIIYVEPRNIATVTDAIGPYSAIIGIVTSLATLTFLVIQLSRSTP